MPQEIKKIPIVIASILKPVDDTRMLEKMGHTISKKSDVAITIIGYPTKTKELPNSYAFTSYNPFKRLSFGRIQARLIFLRTVLAIKPKLIILTTHELLLASLLAKWISGCRLIYDVQENYYRNIIHSHTFPIIIRQLVAGLVRLKEILFSSAIDHFFLAEAAYQTELNFLYNRYTILQNKVSMHTLDNCSFVKENKADGKLHLIFSGTLGIGTGVFEAIRWTKLFHQVDPNFRLTIIGYCANPMVLRKIQNEIDDSNYITMIGGNQLVPHTHVLQEISKSDGGFITYPPSTSTSGSIPTKLFEYLAFQLPILLVPHQPWVDFCAPYNAAIILDNTNSVEQLISNFKHSEFYVQKPNTIYWEDQEASLLSTIDKILS